MQPATLLSVVLGGILCFCCSVIEGGREKRYLFINPEAPITLGFLLNMPISLALPTLASVNGRSFNLERANDPSKNQEVPEELLWEPAYEQQLERLSIYFAHLELFYLGCQERLICDLAAEPESFSPIGEIFLKELRQANGPVKTSTDSLIWRYMTAARAGFTSTIDGCQETYPSCPMGATKILNIPVLKVWQYIADRLNLKLV